MNKSTILINQCSFLFLNALIFFTPIVELKKVIFLAGTTIIWLLSSAYLDRSYLPSVRTHFRFLICFFALYLCLCLNNENVKIKIFFTQTFWVYCGVLFYPFYSKNIQIIKKVLPILLLIVLVSSIYTILGNLIFPNASRALAGAVLDDENTFNLLKSLNIGGYDFIYGVTFLVMPVMLLIKNKVYKNIFTRILLLVSILVYIAMVSVASYMTSIIFALALLLLSFSNNNNRRRTIISIIIIGALIFIFIEPFLNLLIDFSRLIDSDVLERRALQILNGTYQEDYDAMGRLSRIERAKNAVSNFFISPIWGKIFGTSSAYLKSGHSAFLQYFETYGTIGCVYIFFYRYIYKSFINTYNIVGPYFTFFFILFITFLFLDTFDTSAGIGFSVFSLCPIIFKIVDDELSSRASS